MTTEETKFQPKDYKSDQYVRWCPGCGDHAVLNCLHKAMAEVGVAPHNMAVISGIGCSSRLPYYMNTYGFHTIHGRGAAIATGIGQCSTLLIYILFYIFKKPPVTIRKHLLRPEKNVCIRLYGVGIPGALNMALPSLLISALNGILASISESGVIILGIYYKLQTFLYLSVNGMIQGMRPLMGYNYGAKEYRRVNKIYRLALTIAIGIMTAGTLLFMFTPETFMKMFTTQETTIAAGASALRIISCGFIVSSVSVVSSGALDALGKGNESLVVSLLRYLVIIVPLAFVLSRFIGANGVWHSFWITETVTAFVAYGIYRKALRNK